METRLLKGVGLIAALAVVGLVWLARLKAQPAAGAPKASLVTTNWIGCLVVGKSDFVDNMARGLHPSTVQEVQIGLRSDGAVVWRDDEGK